MCGEEDRSRFEAVSRRATEICQRDGAESGPARAEKEVVCRWELLALSTSVFVANIKRLVGWRSDSGMRLDPVILQDWGSS